MEKLTGEEKPDRNRQESQIGQAETGRGKKGLLPAATILQGHGIEKTRPRGYKTVFMLNSTEHKIFPAHKC